MNTDTRPILKSRGDRRRGQAMIEFALSFLLFLSVVLGFGQLALSLWIKNTLHQAVRQGTRFAITGQTLNGQGHDASIRSVVVEKSVGLIKAADADSLVTIAYYDGAGNSTSSNQGGNTIVLSVANYPIPWLVPLPLSAVGGGLDVSVSSVDRLEPFPTATAR
jgi:Flp pilus assembly protein TadG